MFQPFLSVVVTTHCRPALLRRALSSLLNQSFLNFEIILVADVFDYETFDVAKNLLRPSDVFLSCPALKGPSESRNLAVSLARGKWVSFLDDDDIYSSDYVGKFFEAQPSFNCNAYYTNYVKINGSDSSGDHTGGWLINTGSVDIRQIWVSNFIPNSAVVVNSNLAKQLKFDPALNSHEDWDWLIGLVSMEELRHLDLLGPIIFENSEGSRNSNSITSGNIAIDYLSIYRRWKIQSSIISEARQKCLDRLGLKISSEFL